LKSTLVAPPESVSLPEKRDSERRDGDGVTPSKTRPSPPAKASSIILVGTSFKTSSLTFREALARRISHDSERLSGLPGVKEYAQLVTCNRIEILIASDSADMAERALLDWVSSTPGMGQDSVYVRRDVDAIAHLFRVSSGLDSMVLGEEQILSQVKDAGVAARTTKSSRGTLSALFDASVNVGRRARSALKEADDSVSSIAIRFALERLPHAPRSVLLVGTGKTTRLAANQLDGAKLYVATRRASVPSFSRATMRSATSR